MKILTAEEKLARFERLPIWAKQEIDRLERDVEYWKTKAHVGPGESDTFVHHFGAGQQPLGRGETIRFFFDDGHYLDVDNKRNYVHVSSDDSLCIQPQSGNLAKVWSEEWKR